MYVFTAIICTKHKHVYFNHFYVYNSGIRKFYCYANITIINVHNFFYFPKLKPIKNNSLFLPPRAPGATILLTVTVNLTHLSSPYKRNPVMFALWCLVSSLYNITSSRSPNAVACVTIPSLKVNHIPLYEPCLVSPVFPDGYMGYFHTWLI